MKYLKTEKMKKITVLALVMALAMTLFTGCGSQEDQTAAAEGYMDVAAAEDILIEEEAIALSEAPAALTQQMLLAEASGTAVKKTDKVWIDYSNTKDGYVMVKYLNPNSKKLKVQVKGPVTTYTYNLTPTKWETFPLSDGNGNYQVLVLENVEGTKYALKSSVGFTVQLTDQFAPFVRPNQYVDHAAAVNTVAKAKELCADADTPLKKVEKVYKYVVTELTYDKAKAQNVQSGYLPVLDTVLQEKKGICFDYAALMTGMLRSQNVPCKLVVGYAGNAYHAWISVYVEGQGWIEGVVYFDGTSWQRMDPTFASSGKQSESIMKYIGDGSNYSAKYFY